MRNIIKLKQHVRVGAAVLLVALGGCGPKDGEDGEAGGGVAFLRADKPKAGSEEPPPGDPADLLVDLGSFALECADPYAFPMCSADEYHRFSFVLTPAQQQPGVYPVAELAAQVDLQSTQDSPCESNGPFPAAGGGTVEVVSIDAQSLVIRLADIDEDFPGGEGEHTIVRCAG